MLKYIELKTDQQDQGPAWIARVTLSKSGRTVYFNGKALKRVAGGGAVGNHFDLETGDEYWVSGAKRDGTDRHHSGRGVIWIETSAVAEYLEHTGETAIDRARFRVIPDLAQTDPTRFVARENERSA